MDKLLRIDLGCGESKKEGTIGIDILARPGVDYVLDVQKDTLPFPNKSVEYVHSSHFLEHVSEGRLPHILSEISRVCVDGAKLEFWTPYTWSNSAFIFGHQLFLNEDHYLHMCVWHPEFWETHNLKARWLLSEIIYIIEPDILTDLYQNNMSLDLALKYYKGIVAEFGVFMEVRHGYKGPPVQPKRTFALNRVSEKYPISSRFKKSADPTELQKAIEWFSSP